MRIFYRDEKINFVDDNNVFVGYDIEETCCEYADWFIEDNITDAIPDIDYKNKNERLNRDNITLDGFNFDKDFIEELNTNDSEEYIVAFRLTNGNKEKFLHIFNCHNGYYGHGFEFGINQDNIVQVITDGVL